MSSLNIALVAEGKTDYVIIEAALKAFLPGTFVLTQLQPEDTLPKLGTGWGGVLKWCMMTSSRFQGPISQDPTLDHFDLVIVHIDADVSTFQYQDLGDNISNLAVQKNWATLPCVKACPPIQDTIVELKRIILSWLNPASFGSSIICIPAQSSGTWLAAALLPANHNLLRNAECNINVENGLQQLPKAARVKKTKRDYQSQAPLLTDNWAQVKSLCSQAVAFEEHVLGAL